MPQTVKTKTTFFYELPIAPAARPDAKVPAWLTRLREAGRSQFERDGFPNPKAEEWRFTNFAPITRTSFKPAEKIQISSSQIAAHRFNEQAAIELVFVNGHYDESLSTIDQ